MTTTEQRPMTPRQEQVLEFIRANSGRRRLGAAQRLDQGGRERDGGIKGRGAVEFPKLGHGAPKLG